MSKIWEIFNKISIIITIVSFFMGFGIRPFFSKKWHKFKIWLARKKIDDSTGVLVISVGRHDIKETVKSYLNSQVKFKEIKNRNIFEIKQINDNLGSKDWEILSQKLDLKIKEMNEKGILKIHLFMATSLPFACLVGNVVANRTTVFVYQRATDGKSLYSYLGELSK